MWGENRVGFVDTPWPACPRAFTGSDLRALHDVVPLRLGAPSGTGGAPGGMLDPAGTADLGTRHPTNFSTETPNIFAKASATALLIGRFPDSIADM